MRLAYPFVWPSRYLGVRQAWTAHRWAWTFLGLTAGLLVLLGLAGAMLIHQRAEASDGSLHAAYSSLQRVGSTTAFELIPGEGQAVRGRAVLCLGHDILEAWQVETMEPRPVSEATVPRGRCFAVQFLSSAETSPALRVLVRPRRVALPARGTVWMAGNVPVPVRAWVLP